MAIDKPSTENAEELLSSVSVIVRPVRQGRRFVSKRAADHDGRRCVTELTTRVRADVERTYPARVRTAPAQVIDRVDSEETSVIRKALRRIRDGRRPTDDDSAQTVTG